MKSNIRSLSIFLPAYNESENISKSVNALIKSIPENIIYELIVVDDGSTDSTPQIVRNLIKNNDKIRLIRHRKNMGYGSAIATGLRASKKDWIFFADSDAQFDYRQIKKFINASNNYDMVIGYREKRADPFVRKLNSNIYNLCVKIIYRFWVKDVNCAFKLVKREVYENIKPIGSKGALVSAEIIIKAKREKYNILELPVRHLPRKKGVQTGANIKVILRSFKEIIKLRSYL